MDTEINEYQETLQAILDDQIGRLVFASFNQLNYPLGEELKLNNAALAFFEQRNLPHMLMGKIPVANQKLMLHEALDKAQTSLKEGFSKVIDHIYVKLTENNGDVKKTWQALKQK